MGKLRLTIAFWDYDRVRPLIDGTIQPEGIELMPVISRPSDTPTPGCEKPRRGQQSLIIDKSWGDSLRLEFL